MTTDLERRLRALRDELPEPPVTIDPDALLGAPVATVAAVDELVPLAPVPRRGRTRWVVAALVAAVLVAGVVVTVEVVRRGGTTDRRDAVSELSTTRIDPATQVVHDGDRVEGDGEIVAVEGKPVVFCAPAGSTLGTISDDPLLDCRVRVEVTGVDLAALATREEHPANSTSAAWVTGYAHLVGTWHDGALVDVTQSAIERTPGVEDLPGPPCAPPAGGWPQVPIDTPLDPAVTDYQARHPDRIVSIALLRASDTQVVAYVLTVGDPAPVETALAPEVGPSLCVVRSRYTPGQITAADAALATTGPLWTDFGAYSSFGAGSIGADAQPQLTVGLPLVSDGAVAAIRGLAPGLVQFDPWLSPVA